MPKRNSEEDQARQTAEYRECHRLSRRISELCTAADVGRVRYGGWDITSLRNCLIDSEKAILAKSEKQAPNLETTNGRALAAAVLAVQTGMSVTKCRRVFDK